MQSLTARLLVGVAAVTALVLGYALPGANVLAAGMLAFLVLPLLLRTPIGVPVRTDEGVQIVTGRNAGQRMDVSVRILGILSWLAFAWAATLGRDGIVVGVFPVLIGNGAALLAMSGLILRVLLPYRDAHGVTLERQTFTVNGAGGNHIFRYAQLERVEVEDKRIWLVTDKDRVVVDVLGSAQLAATIATTIREAKARAEDAAQRESGGARELHRPSGMSAREWLGRIDALVAAGRDTNAYRGSAIDEEALWTLLRDETADGEARAAAARVLASSPDGAVRTRVESTASEITSDAARVRVDIAMKPDAEDAAAELEALDMEELRRTAGV